MPATPELDIIQQTHPEYTDKIDNLTFLQAAYFGTGGFADGTYIVKYTNESTDKYDERKDIAYYPNYVKSIVNTYGGHLYKQEPVRDEKGNEILETFISKTNLKGNKNMDSIMKDAFQLSMALGYCYVFVDSPDTLVETAASEKELDIRPYAYIISPISVTNWGLDNKGNFEWILIKETYVENQETPFQDNPDTIERYRYWDKKEWAVYDILESEVVLIASNTHTLGRIPIVPVYFEEIPGEIVGVSGVEEIARLNKRLYNLLSELDDILRKQTFAILTYQGNLPDELGLDTDRAMTYDQERPAFIAPPSVATDAYRQTIDAITGEIFRIAKLDHQGVTATTKDKSGIALIVEFEKTEEALQSGAKQMKQVEYNIYELVLLWAGKAVKDIKDEITVEYADSYGIKDYSTLIDAVSEAIMLNIPSDTFYKELYKKTTSVLLPDASIDTRKKINKEIDEAQSVVNINGDSLGNESVPETVEATEEDVADEPEST
jgi:hypothetical protein